MNIIVLKVISFGISTYGVVTSLVGLWRWQ